MRQSGCSLAVSCLLAQGPWGWAASHRESSGLQPHWRWPSFLPGSDPPRDGGEVCCLKDGGDGQGKARLEERLHGPAWAQISLRCWGRWYFPVGGGWHPSSLADMHL